MAKKCAPKRKASKPNTKRQPAWIDNPKQAAGRTPRMVKPARGAA